MKDDTQKVTLPDASGSCDHVIGRVMGKGWLVFASGAGGGEGLTTEMMDRFDFCPRCGQRTEIVAAPEPEVPEDEIETFNKFLVSSRGEEQIAFLRPLPQVLSHADGLLLAAYIVAIVADRKKWAAILRAVETS